MLSSLFHFFDAFGVEDIVVVQDNEQCEKWGSMSSTSAATSPMSAGGTPKMPFDDPQTSELSPASRLPADVSPTRRERRSSVFFRLPDVDVKDRQDGVAKAGKDISPAKVRRPRSTRRRAASILPERSPRSFAVHYESNDTSQPFGDDPLCKAKGRAEHSDQHADLCEPWQQKPRGELLRGWQHSNLTSDHTVDGTPRPSSRALSEGHRRESVRDGSRRKAPKGLSAKQLLADAKDVARIREQARLRAAHQGICWMASNWRVGGEQGVLSGRRYIVLCDKMVWAELHTTDKDKLPSVAEELGMNQKEGGFLPIISLHGATVQHCEVPKSNNGWIIEIVNLGSKVTLWLDPDTPTGLLKWGSVLCHALYAVERPDRVLCSEEEDEEEDTEEV